MTREDVETGEGLCVFFFTVTERSWRKDVVAGARNADVILPT